jgi:amino acid transporter
MDDPGQLRRSLNLSLLVLYGLGTTIGAGIYALIGEIAGIAGYLAPFAFLVASIMAGITAVSFAELARRLPRAAGEALYVRTAFHSKHLATVTGILVVFAGLVSAAALINGFVGYLHVFLGLDRMLAILPLTLLLGAIAAWGIGESITIAAVITVVEAGGLLLVIAAGQGPLWQQSGPDWAAEILASSAPVHWGGLFTGAVLAFYAFIGFEDMVNVAEEVKNVRRNLPLAIFLTLGLTTLIYFALMGTAVLTVAPAELAGSDAPLAYLYEQYTGQDAGLISIIGMFAIINGALIQMVMAARVIYGLSTMGQLPAALARVSPQTRTPLVATLLVTLVVLALALAGRLASLAEATSIIMLTVFALVNMALWRIKQVDPHPGGIKVYPSWVPIIGFMVCTGFVVSEMLGLLGAGG